VAVQTRRVGLRALVGSGDRIALVTLPFLVAGITANILAPGIFQVGGPPAALRMVSAVMLVIGLTVWLWSALLILVRVPRGELITQGPYAVAKHPLDTGVALLVLPWIGFLVNTWLGAVIGLVLYVASRRLSPAEEAILSARFGARWAEYRRLVKLPWV
jgi:protein-S-isoprenylcysteine O-methyltransferase Ste14